LFSQKNTFVFPDPVTKFVPVIVPEKFCPAVGVLGFLAKLLIVGGAGLTVKADDLFDDPADVETYTWYEPAPPRLAFVMFMFVELVVLIPAVGCS
jgi:hypothetical protein